MKLTHAIAYAVLSLGAIGTFACRLAELSDQEFASLESTVGLDAQDLAQSAVMRWPSAKDDLLVIAGSIVRIDPAKGETYASTVEALDFGDVAMRISLRHLVMRLDGYADERSSRLAKSIASGMLAGIELAEQAKAKPSK